MKKIFLLFITFISCLSLSACSNSVEDYLQEYIKDELHDYVFQYYTNSDTGEVTKSSRISNEIATAILMLDGYITIDVDSLLTKADSSIEEVTKTYEDMYIYDVYTGFNMILVSMLLDLDVTNLETYFEGLSIYDFETSDWYKGEDGNPIIVFDQFAALTTINCLNMLDVNNDLKTELISKFDDINELSYIDADIAAMVVISLQGDAHQDYLDVIYDSITSKGVANYNGELSCSSTSQVLMALMSEGVVYNNNSLIDCVLSFRTNNGFKEYLDDDSRNLSYASPQAFLSLTTAYLFEETSNKVLFY